jgi:hypothetical protein
MSGFNVDEWAAAMADAIKRKDAETLATLMGKNDRNGCFSYADVCSEFGEITIEKWAAGTIECAKTVLADLPNHI